MGKGKYLTYFLLNLFLNFSSSKILANSAWLPEKGKYKVGISNSKIDKDSKENKDQRIEKFLKVEHRVENLLDKLSIVKDELNTLQRSEEEYKLKYHVDLPSDDEVELKKSELSNQIKRLMTNIDSLKKVLCLLSPYQQYELYSAYIEYAPGSNISFGLDSYISENRFINSKYTSARYKSITKSAGLFFKYRIFQKKNWIFSIQPKVIFDKQSSFISERVFHEMSILGGVTKKIGKVEFFTQGVITIGGGSSNLSKKKKYYSYAYSEGTKFPYGITIVKFSKHSLNLNSGFAYKRNVYEQLSVAKKFQFGKLGSKNITIQLGYFWDYNPNYSLYKMSGTVFSLCSEI